MSVSSTHCFLAKQLLTEAVRQKAFNYFVQGNVLLTYFEGDDRLLYMVFEMSAIEVIY